MLKVGITGGIGSGKSIVAKIMETLGYKVFYSDKCAKDVMLNDLDIKRQLIASFGDKIFVGKSLNKELLSHLLFEKKENQITINSIVHPKVRSLFEEFCALNVDEEIIFNEAAILFETGAYLNFDKIILVKSPLDLKLKRVSVRDSISIEEVFSRMSAQWSDEQNRNI